MNEGEIVTQHQKAAGLGSVQPFLFIGFAEIRTYSLPISAQSYFR